jgi:hypothetical protein
VDVLRSNIDGIHHLHVFLYTDGGLSQHSIDSGRAVTMATKTKLGTLSIIQRIEILDLPNRIILTLFKPSQRAQIPHC